jgi:hypothetical protein
MWTNIYSNINYYEDFVQNHSFHKVLIYSVFSYRYRKKNWILNGIWRARLSLKSTSVLQIEQILTQFFFSNKWQAQNFTTNLIYVLYRYMLILFCTRATEPSWPWSYGCWIYNYVCNRGEHDTPLCDKACQWLVTGRRF